MDGIENPSVNPDEVLSDPINTIPTLARLALLIPNSLIWIMLLTVGLSPHTPPLVYAKLHSMIYGHRSIFKNTIPISFFCFHALPWVAGISKTIAYWIYSENREVGVVTFVMCGVGYLIVTRVCKWDASAVHWVKGKSNWPEGTWY